MRRVGIGTRELWRGEYFIGPRIFREQLETPAEAKGLNHKKFLGTISPHHSFI
jgi:hypothetical protein